MKNPGQVLRYLILTAPIKSAGSIISAVTFRVGKTYDKTLTKHFNQYFSWVPSHSYRCSWCITFDFCLLGKVESWQYMQFLNMFYWSNTLHIETVDDSDLLQWRLIDNFNLLIFYTVVFFLIMNISIISDIDSHNLSINFGKNR